MRRTAPLVVSLLAAVAGGCGGKGESNESGLPRAQLVNRADAICSRAKADTQKQVPKGLPGKLGALTAASVSDKTAPKYLSQLEKLEPRKADAKTWNAYLEAERRVAQATRAAIGAKGGDAFFAALAKAREPSQDSERAAAALGLDACTKAPTTHIGTSGHPAAERPGETRLREVGLSIRLPRGWRPFRISDPGAQAYGDDESDCAFVSYREKPPGNGSQEALYDFAQRAVREAKKEADAYKLVSLETQPAQNATGVAIVRTSRKGSKRRAGRVAFFFARGRRYVVDCKTDDPTRLRELDARVFKPLASSARIVSRGG